MCLKFIVYNLIEYFDLKTLKNAKLCPFLAAIFGHSDFRVNNSRKSEKRLKKAFTVRYKGEKVYFSLSDTGGSQNSENLRVEKFRQHFSRAPVCPTKTVNALAALLLILLP